MATRTPYVYDVITKSVATGPSYNFSEITLLVVDCCHPFRKMVSSVLMRFGFQGVYEASSGEEAIEHLRHHPIDIVMTEWAIGPVDGHKLVQWLRADAGDGEDETRIIMLTGLTEKARVLAARDAGVDGFLRKPVSPETLFKRIVRVIEHPVGVANMHAHKDAKRRVAAIKKLQTESRE